MGSCLDVCMHSLLGRVIRRWASGEKTAYTHLAEWSLLGNPSGLECHGLAIEVSKCTGKCLVCPGRMEAWSGHSRMDCIVVLTCVWTYPR